MGMLVNPYRHVAAGGVDTLADLFASGEIGDFWIADAANTDGNVATDVVSTITGTINGLVPTFAANIGTAKLEASGSVLGTRLNGGTGSGQRFSYNFGSDISQPMTLILCLLSGDTSTHIMACGSSGTKRLQISNDSSDNIVAFMGGTGPFDSTINSPLGATARVLTVIANGSSPNSKWRVDGTQTATGNMGTAVTNQLTIGSNFDGNFSCNGLFFAWLFINRVLDSTELARAEARLAQCAGITL